MRTVYPIVINKDFVVYAPDFNINTEGSDLADAMEMARDAIAMTGCCMEDQGQALPSPSPISDVQHEAGDVVTLVDVDFTAYRRQNDQRAVRRNVTIPAWLDSEAKKQDINFSRVLQEALLQRIGKSV